MKIPDTFKPEQNLDENTERLLKKKEEPKTEKQPTELEEVLKLVGEVKAQDAVRPELYSKIDHLLEQNKYQEVTRKKAFWKCYTKLSDKDCHRVFIKRFKHGNGYYYFRTYGYTDYGYADVKRGKLEEFCKRYDTHEKRSINPTSSIAGCFIGMGVGLASVALGNISYYAIKGIAQPELPFQALTLGYLGMLAGAILGGLVYPVVNGIINKRKLDKCYSYLTTDAKDAVEEAFS